MTSFRPFLLTPVERWVLACISLHLHYDFVFSLMQRFVSFIPIRKWPWGKWLVACFMMKRTMTWCVALCFGKSTLLLSHNIKSPCCVPPPPQGAHSTSGADNEYNLRSRTVICDSCGQMSERGSGVNSRGGLPEGLVGHSFFIGTNEPRQVVIKWNSLHVYLYCVCCNQNCF